MTPEQFANAVWVKSGAINAQFWFNDCIDGYEFYWYFDNDGLTVEIPCNMTRHLIEDMHDWEVWIQATIDHCRAELQRPEGKEKHSVFGIDSDGKYFDIDRVNPWLYGD